ncbi:MAG TPA: alpha/beta fold hydrolase [Longimicrobium sp.]|jgi:pimeloyl-ACP methyl ester carboxylesterase
MSTIARTDVPRKSTTDRSLDWRFRAVRGWFAALSTVSPGLAAAHASRIFFKPQRRTRSAPGVLGGVEPVEFRIRSGQDQVVGWSYGSGPTVLLVHGWGGCAGDWSGLTPLLTEAGYRVVMFDFPAHGLSSGVRTALPDMVRAIHSVALELAFGPAGGFAPVEAVVAHSFGGAAAVLAAREGLLARRMVLLNPVWVTRCRSPSRWRTPWGSTAPPARGCWTASASAPGETCAGSTWCARRRTCRSPAW